MNSQKTKGYAIYALLPRKNEKYRRRDVKVGPKWLCSDGLYILESLILFLVDLNLDHHTFGGYTVLYLVEEICFF